MSLLSRAQELEDISDAQLAQLVQQGSEAGDTWLAATETQRRKDMRDRYQAEQAKQQAASPPDIMTQRLGELGGGIPSADPNIGAPPDPSLQTGIAGPPQGGPPPGGPPPMAGGGLIRGYQQGAGVGGRAEEARQRLEEAEAKQRQKAELDEWLALGRVRPPLADYQTMSEADRSGIVPAWKTPESEEARQALSESMTPEVTPQDVRAFAEREGISPEEALDLFYPGGFLPTTGREPSGLREAVLGGGPPPPTQAPDAITFDPNTGRAMRGGKFYSPELDDRLDSNMDDLLAMRAAAIAAGDQVEYDKIQVGIAELERSMAYGPRTGDGGQGRDSIRDILDAIEGGGHRLGTLAGVYAEGEGRVADYLASQKETPADRAWYERRMSATERAREQAGGIRSLDLERIGEEELLLAKGMGISEDRISELMREMDTPGEVESRRKSAGYGALSSMFLNPDLAAGIGGMGGKITAMDDILRAERKTALTGIHAERQTGFDFEDLKRQGIFDVKRKSQKEYDTADIAVDNMEATILKAKAEQGRAGEKEAMQGYLDLLKSQAMQIGAWNSTMAQVNAQMQTAIMNRDNELAKTTNWEAIRNELADIRSSPMMDDPVIAKWVEDTDKLIMITKVGQLEDEAWAIQQGRPPSAITESSVSTRTSTPGGGTRTGSRSGVNAIIR